VEGLAAGDQVRCGDRVDGRAEVDRGILGVPFDVRGLDAAVRRLEPLDVDDLADQLRESRWRAVELGVLVDVHRRGGDAEVVPVHRCDGAAEIHLRLPLEIALALLRKADGHPDAEAFVEARKLNGGVDAWSAEVQGCRSLRRGRERKTSRGIGLRGKGGARDVRLQRLGGGAVGGCDPGLQREAFMRSGRTLVASERGGDDREQRRPTHVLDHSWHQLGPLLGTQSRAVRPGRPFGVPAAANFLVLDPRQVPEALGDF